MKLLRNPNPFDRQLERSRLKTPRHPFWRLAELVSVLFALSAVLFVVGVVSNTVPAPVAGQRTSSVIAPEAARLGSIGAGSGRPEHWSVRMASAVVNGRQVEVGIVDDERVSLMVRTDFAAAYRWLFATGWHADYTTTVSTYFSDAPGDGPDVAGMVSGIRAFLNVAAARGEFVQVHVLDNSLEKNVQVFDYSADGLTVHISTVVTGKSQRWSLGFPSRLLDETPIQPENRLFYMLNYDPADWRWKIVNG